MNPRMQKPTRALIAGGGIAGLSLGFWLEKMGLNPVVIDRVDRFLPLGHYITLKGNGVDMLRQMGLLNQARTRESGFKQVIIFDAFGRALRKGSTAEFDQTLGGYIALRRSDLHAVLFEAVQGKFEIGMGSNQRPFTRQKTTHQLSSRQGNRGVRPSGRRGRNPFPNAATCFRRWKRRMVLIIANS